MPLVDLDHINIRTGDLERLVGFYQDVLGLSTGARPPLNFGGAWLYCGERAAVHLVKVAKTPDGHPPRLEHFAFKASGLADFLGHLRAREVPYRISIVPGRQIRQVNIHDPDGNHIEIAFPPEEQADLTDYPGAAAQATSAAT